MQGKGKHTLPLHPIPSTQRSKKCQECARSKMSGILPAVQAERTSRGPQRIARIAKIGSLPKFENQGPPPGAAVPHGPRRKPDNRSRAVFCVTRRGHVHSVPIQGEQREEIYYRSYCWFAVAGARRVSLHQDGNDAGSDGVKAAAYGREDRENGAGGEGAKGSAERFARAGGRAQPDPGSARLR